MTGFPFVLRSAGRTCSPLEMLSRAPGMLQVGCCLKGSYRESHLIKSLLKLWNFHDEPFLLCVTGSFSGRNKEEAPCLLPSQFTHNTQIRQWVNSLLSSTPAYFPLHRPNQSNLNTGKSKRRTPFILKGFFSYLQYPWPHPCSVTCWNHCIWSQICSWQLKLLLQCWWTQHE